MNDFGIALFWLSVQVGVLAPVGLALSAMTARRSPGAGAAAALTALGATLVLAVLACCPLPAWWAWCPDPGTALAEPAIALEGEQNFDPSTERLSRPGERAQYEGMRLGELMAVVRKLGPGLAAVESPVPWTHYLPGFLATVAVAATLIGLLRLLHGIWGMGQILRRSTPVLEADLLRLIDEYRLAMKVSRPVVVRESADLASAGTVGWWTPVLLLPRDWRGWTREQLRAVIAHELAHVGRGDFAAWLLARLSVAVYFWHPLVRLLAGRLHLQQELAADAEAARLAGGRRAYLRALAALALRSQGCGHGWPAPAFLSPKGTLLRRVQMLHVTDEGAGSPVSRSWQWLVGVTLLSLTLTVSTWRGSVREALAGPPVETAKAAQQEVAAFDISLVAGLEEKDVDGVFGIRPAAILKRPTTESLLPAINAQINSFAPEIKKSGLDIRVEDVEQVMGRIYFGGENQPGKRSLMASLTVLRMNRDIDWEKLREQCGPKMKQHQYKGQTYVELAISPSLKGLIGFEDIFLWASDRRTLVFDDESHIKTLIDARVSGKKPPVPEYAAGWAATTSHALLAVAINNRDHQLVDRTVTKEELKTALADPTSPEFHLARMYQKVSGVLISIAGDDDLRIDVSVSAATPADAADLVKECEGLVTAAKKSLAAMKSDASTAKAAADDPLGEELFDNVVNKLVDAAVVCREGKVVTIHAEMASGFNQVLSRYVTSFRAEK